MHEKIKVTTFRNLGSLNCLTNELYIFKVEEIKFIDYYKESMITLLITIMPLMIFF